MIEHFRYGNDTIWRVFDYLNQQNEIKSEEAKKNISYIKIIKLQQLYHHRIYIELNNLDLKNKIKKTIKSFNLIKILPNKDKLTGTFVNDILIKGEIKDHENYTKIGTFKDNKLHGIDCKKIFPDGSTHEGEFINDELNGNGEIYNQPNGYRSYGTYYNGRLHGDNCKNICPNDREDEGFFEHGVLKKGIRSYTNGIRLEGSFNIDLFEGIKYSPGYIEEGEFKFNNLHGFGKRTKINGNTHKGFFIRGELYRNHKKWKEQDDNILNKYFRTPIYDINKIHALAITLGWVYDSRNNHTKYKRNNDTLILSCTPKTGFHDWHKIRDKEIDRILAD